MCRILDTANPEQDPVASCGVASSSPKGFFWVDLGRQTSGSGSGVRTQPRPNQQHMRDVPRAYILRCAALRSGVTPNTPSEPGMGIVVAMGGDYRKRTRDRKGSRGPNGCQECNSTGVLRCGMPRTGNRRSFAKSSFVRKKQSNGSVVLVPRDSPTRQLPPREERRTCS